MKTLFFFAGFLFFVFSVNSQEWTSIGSTYSNPSPYPLNYFLLFDLNNYGGDVSAEFEIMVFADDNYMYHSRYSIFVSKNSGTGNQRVDGVTFNYISGRPEMLDVLVKQNQIWIKATKKWGEIRYRLIDQRNYGNWTTPLTLQTTTPPNILFSSIQPFYYDLDNSQVNYFPSLLSNGNVGIGTPNPDSKLTVAGNIHSREVKVTVNAGADFVFEDNYNLPTLEEVQQFINKNGHLPEIASAKDMEENGIHLAEMNIKLLQKIEELTLYAIEQEKKLKGQEIINQELEARLIKLEQIINRDVR